MPSFSVIVAAYDAAETIAEAVASALDQTLPPLEVIVCDDGSTDETLAALAPFGDRIRVLEIEHAGAGAARNAAARASSGEFVAILDADDVYLPERLEALGELAAARPDLDILTTDATLESDGAVLGTYYDRVDFEIVDQRRGILVRDFIFGAAAIRRTALDRVRGYDESLSRAEDRDLWIRLIFSGARAGLVGEPLFRRRLRAGARSADRLRNIEAGIAVVGRARAQQALTPSEDRAAGECLEAMRVEAAIGEADIALRERLPDRRARALALLRTPGVTARTRLKALLAAASPELARRRLLDQRSDPRTRSETADR